MNITMGWKLAGLATLGIGAGIALGACGGKKPAVTGPMSDLSNDLMLRLHPSAFRGIQQLDLATESVLQVQREDGSHQGAYDGTRLLQAADSHAYGTPTILDPKIDRKNDGKATFNEVRHVVQSFDVDGSLRFDRAETRAFEDAVGIQWIPA